MRAIAQGLRLEPAFFDDKIDEQCHNLRLLSYPPIKRAVLQGEGQARAGAHTGERWPPAQGACLLTAFFFFRLRHGDTTFPGLSE